MHRFERLLEEKGELGAAKVVDNAEAAKNKDEINIVHTRQEKPCIIERRVRKEGGMKDWVMRMMVEVRMVN